MYVMLSEAILLDYGARARATSADRTTQAAQIAPGTVGEINFVLGKKIVFCASPTSVATTFQYMQEYGSPSLRWE